METPILSERPTFIDLFSGCGGLSLGLAQSGWQGIFAIERATDAFETFRANFLDTESRHRFLWPDWLAQSAHSIDDVLKNHEQQLKEMLNTVDLIAGGPPCQGFSFAGKRSSSDPRNKLFERYVSFVGLIKPKFLVLENVPGMKIAHARAGSVSVRSARTYYDKLHAALSERGYVVEPMDLDATNFGVPQRRNRLVVIGVRPDVAKRLPLGTAGVLERIHAVGVEQLRWLGGGHPVTAEDAISDLVVGPNLRGAPVIEYTRSTTRRGYKQLDYEGPNESSAYQKFMNEGVARDEMDSMRLARHTKDVRDRFKRILARTRGRRGVNLSEDDRKFLGMRKHRTVPMSPSQPAPTLTTLPDDILHYSDPRILTVRESARLQSFPDWFTFHGKYTTGGDRRKVECPRYTQVGNAVPPLLARAVGVALLEACGSVPADPRAEHRSKSGIGKKTLFKTTLAR